MGSDGRTDVAVLGGGVGGMTAAYELSKTEALRDQFSVTVYQLGWRLGGKGASGRNEARAQRIEEHGLHLWFGFYANAFEVMAGVYRELGRRPEEKLASIDEAFEACPEVVLWDQLPSGEWRPYSARMPEAGNPPWSRGHRPPTILDLLERVLDWARGRGSFHGAQTPSLPAAVDAELAKAEQELRSSIQQQLLDLDQVQKLLGGLVNHAERARDLLQAEWADTLTGPGAETETRVRFGAFDVFVATFRGIHDDRVLYRGITAIDHLDWTEWLRRHGATDFTAGRSFRERSPVLRAIYDVAFCFPGGDVDAADAAAGTAMSDLFKLALDYRGAIAYKMNAGMGDAIFAPMYQLLQRWKVKFRFFHAVSDLRASADGQWIDEIEVVPQLGREYADLEYEPLVDVGGLPSWPSEPRSDQGLPEFALGGGRSLETSLDPFGKGPEAIRLTRRGAAVEPGAREFDHAVLGIPVGALPAIAGDLMRRRPSFGAMVRRGAKDTVATQAFQVWTTEPPDDLGVVSPASSVSATFVEPLDTYCDMGQVLGEERHPPEVKGVAYVCGVLPEVSGESHADSQARVKRNAIEYVERHIGGLWRGLGDASPWDVLHDPEDRAGRARFDAQYWRANVAPWERYVITPSGNVATRLRSDGSGFRNLAMAGDWTANVINGGCVEAAVISGRQAARQLTEKKFEIDGEDPMWLTPPGLRQPAGGRRAGTAGAGAPLPEYAEFGGRSSFPGPFHCVEGDMRMFILLGDMGKIRALVKRVLTDPAAGRVEYRPVLPFVLFMHGLNVVSSKVPPWDRFGRVDEVLAAFWVPVLAGERRDGKFVATRLCMSLPHILVDNPISHYAGREIYGFPKSLGRFTGRADEILIQGYGGDFASDSVAQWFDFVRTRRRGPLAANAHLDSVSSEAEAVAMLAPAAARELEDVVLAVESGPDPGARRIAGVEELLRRIFADFRQGTMHQVFLKQFRDAGDHTRAAYQAIVEADARTKTVDFDFEPGFWKLEIANARSHPIGDELGLFDQWAGFSVRIRGFEFDVEPGTVVAP